MAITTGVICSNIGCASKELSYTPIALNPLGYSASDGNVSEVEFKSEAKKIKSKSLNVYKVEPVTYEQKEIDKLVKKLDLGNKVKKDTTNKSMEVYTGENGAHLFYTKDSGTIEYVAESKLENQNRAITGKISNSDYRKKAESFLKNLECINYKEYSFDRIEPSETIEYYPSDDAKETVKEVTKYEVIFKKNTVDEYEFDGIGPGIKVEYDASGEVTSFISIAKEFKKINNQKYNTKSIKDIKKNILNKENVLMDDIYGENNQIIIDSCELVLYSDAANVNQQYAVPHYFLTGKNKNTGDKCEILMPAIEDKYIELKQ